MEPCYTAQLFPPLHSELLKTLRALDEGDWMRPTLAAQWKVRDVAAHLLDGDLRKLAVYRDGHMLPLDAPITNDRDLATLVNGLNASGVAYAARLSPRLITDLLEMTGTWVAQVIAALPPHAPSIFPVSWAGETTSENWMDTGREYTERWHHQMQIRDAAGHPLLLQPRWMMPLLDISVRALPYAYRAVNASAGTVVSLVVSGETDAAWTLRRGEREWVLQPGRTARADTTVRVSTDAAWRLFYNALADVSRVQVEGERALAAPLLETRSVIV